MSEAQKLLPFRNGTRQRIADVDSPSSSVAFQAGGNFTFTLPKVGYLNCLLVHFNGAMTTGAGYVASAAAPFGIIDRHTVIGNQGSSEFFDVSGIGTHYIQRTYGYGNTTVGASADVYSQPANGVNAAAPLNVSWLVPIAMNNGVEFDKGLINLQAPETTITYKGTFATLANMTADGLGTGITSITGTLTVQYLYYEVPDPTRYAQPPVMFVRWLEDSIAVHGTGDNKYTIPRQGILLNMIHVLKLNGAVSDAWDSWALKFNKGDMPYVIYRARQRLLERYRYGLNSPTGVVFLDFMNAFGVVNGGDARDAVDTEENAVTESIVRVSSGAALGANNNTLTTIRRFFQTAAPAA